MRARHMFDLLKANEVVTTATRLRPRDLRASNASRNKVAE